MPTGKPIPIEKIQYVIDHFANTTKVELAADAGISCSSVSRIAKEYGLRKSREHLHNMGVRAGAASAKARGGKGIPLTKEMIERRAESYKKTFREEQIRRKWGLEQRTKIRLRKEPRAKHDQRLFLEKNGYIIDETRLIAYWTETTKRSKRLETRKKDCVFKCYYSFAPYERNGRLD